MAVMLGEGVRPKARTPKAMGRPTGCAPLVPAMLFLELALRRVTVATVLWDPTVDHIRRQIVPQPRVLLRLPVEAREAPEDRAPRGRTPALGSGQGVYRRDRATQILKLFHSARV